MGNSKSRTVKKTEDKTARSKAILHEDHAESQNINDVYTFGRKLGEPGGYGYAQEVTERATGIKRAVKVISKARFQRSAHEGGLDMFRQEMAIMSQMSHPNLVHGYASFEDENNLYFVMELCGGGELFDRIKQHEDNKIPFSEKEAADIFKQVLEGLHYLHAHDIMHCDLKPDNFLFDSSAPDATLKICDFGMSKYVKRRKWMSQICGTTFYMAPEVIGHKYTYHCDMWSVGVVLFILLCGFPPFFGEDDEIKDKILEGFYPEVQEGYGPWFPAHVPLSNAAKDLIAKLLEKDAAVRLSVNEALEHPWLNGEHSTTPILESVISSLNNFRKDCALKRAILDVMAESFTPSELEDAKASFAEYDTNNDGFITIEELKNHAVTTASEALMKLLSVVDVDGDGKISYEELLKASIQKKLLAKEERIYNVFCQLDEDNDGSLSTHEIQAILDEEGDAHALRMLSEIDRDNDGRIDYNEFLNMFFSDSELQHTAEKN